MKRLIALLLALIMVLALTSCKPKPSTPTVDKPEEAEPDEPITEPDETPDDEAEDTPAEHLPREEILALIGEFFKENFPMSSTVYEADVTHDGNSDVIVVDSETTPGEIYGYILTVKDGKVHCINDKVGENAHANNFDWFVSKNEDGPATMYEYLNDMWQGFGTCELVEYYMDAELNRVVVNTFGVGTGWESTCDSEGRVTDAAMDDFNNKVEDIVLNNIVLQLSSCPVSIDTIHTPTISAAKLFGFEEGGSSAPVSKSSLTLFNGKCTVTIPAAWEGRYHMVQNDDYVQFFSKANYDRMEYLGCLLTLYLTDETEEAIKEDPIFPDCDYIGKWSGGVVYVLYPTDVEFDYEDEKLTDEYQEMKNAVKEFVNSITING